MHRICGAAPERFADDDGAEGIRGRRLCLCAARMYAGEWARGSTEGGKVHLVSFIRFSNLTTFRYANMDFIVMSALAGFSLLMLTISYDIACQWKINLKERNENLPADMRLEFEKIKLQCALPVWHAASHNDDCANENSLSFKPGVGKSDGEGIERTWSVLNPAAYSTKNAGKGQRADVIEAKIDNHNYLKNVSEGARFFLL